MLGRFSCKGTMELLRIIVLLLMGVVSGQQPSDYIHYRDFCESEDFTAQCNPGECIIMEQAILGTMKLGRCIKKDLGHLGCFDDVLPTLDTQCTGKNKCKIAKMTKVDFPEAISCSGLALYLEVKYRCAAALQGTALQTVCASNDNLLILHSSELFIFNEDLQSLPCMAQRAHITFRVKLSLGQHINITLMDFGTKEDKCYGSIKESQIGNEALICGGKDRRVVIFISNSNHVEVKLEKGNGHKFALGFQALGCPDLSAPAHGSIKREGDRMSIQCHTTQQTWHLTCRNNHWKGVVGNCSSGMAIRTSAANQQGVTPAAVPSDILLALIIAGALTLSVAAVTLAVVCWKRKTLGLEAAKLKASQEKVLKAPLSDSDYMHPSLRPRSTMDETEDAVYDFCFAPNTPAPIPNNIAVTLPCRGNNFQYNNTITRAPDSPKYKTLIFVNQ